MIRRGLFQRFRRDKRGSTTVEAALIIPILIALTGGGIEAGYALWQYNGAQQAARHGARLAATTNPVAADLRTMSGLGPNVRPGDPLPAYARNCSGATQSCDRGSYDRTAMSAIIFGPDQDGNCAATERPRRGMCDVFMDLSRHNVDINYTGSGLGRAGNPARPVPLVTVTVRDIKFDFIFLDLILPQSWTVMPPVQAGQLAEDLRNG